METGIEEKLDNTEYEALLDGQVRVKQVLYIPENSKLEVNKVYVFKVTLNNDINKYS